MQKTYNHNKKQRLSFGIYYIYMYICIRLATAQHNIQAILMILLSPCIIFTVTE